MIQITEPAYHHGFSPRKAGFLRQFVQSERPIKRLRPYHRAKGQTVFIWGMAPVPACAQGAKIIRVEDGFIRSTGLGAALATPLSWVFDDMGLYLDSRSPSRLEQLLAIDLSPDMRARAERLLLQINTSGVTKYNLPGAIWQRPPDAAGRRLVLVPGQVETDASLKYGAPRIKRNIDLLRAVRARHPQAYILYKPHPDVMAGLRRAGECEHRAQDYCDAVIQQADVISLIDAVDEVHVMTSQLGFEALLRGKPVTCYGQPFYAGWGMTIDILPLARRAKKLDITALVAACLIAYPQYRHPQNHSAPFTPEDAITYLSNIPKASQHGSGMLLALLRLWKRTGTSLNG